jgi:enoyl-CoA hydratase
MMAATVDNFEADPTVRIVVMRGAGDKAFASGAGITQFADQRQNAEQAETYAQLSGAGRAGIGSVQKPLIAMIKGSCISGVTIATMADLRVAPDNALFSIPAAKLGIAQGIDCLSNLVALVRRPTPRKCC